MQEPDIAYHIPLLVISLFVTFFGLSSNYIKKRLFLSEALVSTLFGICIGPIGLGLLRPSSQQISECRLFLHLSRIVIIAQLMATGISVPTKYLRRHWKSLAILLGPVMLSSWLITSAFVFLFFWDVFSWRDSLLIGAMLSPTDPVLSSSIIKGKFAETHVPVYLRTLISVESGANDGAAFPPIHLLILVLITDKISLPTLLSKLAFNVLFWKVFIGIGIGVIFGYFAREALKIAEKLDFIDKESMVAYNFALAFSVSSLSLLLGLSDMLAVFVTGVTFSWDGWVESYSGESEFQNVIDTLFNLTFFVIFGASIPWAVFHANFGMIQTSLLMALVLILRRIPAVVLLSPFIDPIKSPKEALFVGWFGPMGVGAIFYAAYATMLGCNPMILPFIYMIVFSSIVAHGITVPLFHMTTINQTFSLIPPDDDEAADILSQLLSNSHSDGSIVLSETILDIS